MRPDPLRDTFPNVLLPAHWWALPTTHYQRFAPVGVRTFLPDLVGAIICHEQDQYKISDFSSLVKLTSERKFVMISIIFRLLLRKYQRLSAYTMKRFEIILMVLQVPVDF